MSAAALDWLDDLPEPEILEAGREWGQPSLFGAPSTLPLAAGVTPRDYKLTWYQAEAKSATELALETNRSAMIVMATGTGKTRTFGSIAGDWPGNVLVLCHRDELVHQARLDLEMITGEQVEVEQAHLRASSTCRIVVGSTDTVKQKSRLERFGPDRFSLVICDEFHHYLAKTYRRPIDFFKNAKLIGVTATPDRGDEKALGTLIDEVSYVFDIQSGIDQGYLVPIDVREVNVESIDISGVGTSGGDLIAAQLDDVMLKSAASIVSETLKYEPGRQGIVFLPGVKSAELTAELFNKAVPGSACFISGATDIDERRELIRRFKAGEFRYLCNCMIATEGFDAPTVSLIVQGRPTKSRALYAQMAGRGTRVLPGIVHHIPGPEGAAERRAAIAASAKPNMVVLDFVGNAGAHKLVNPVDLLGGDYTEAEVKEAKKKLKEDGGGDVAKALAAARAGLARIAQAAKVRATSSMRSIDPFGNLGERRTDPVEMRFGRKAMTQGQRDFLLRGGVKEKELEGMSRADAHRLQQIICDRRELGLSSYAQARTLKMVGVDASKVPFKQASEAVGYVLRQWDQKLPVDGRWVEALCGRRREPGEEG